MLAAPAIRPHQERREWFGAVGLALAVVAIVAASILGLYLTVQVHHETSSLAQVTTQHTQGLSVINQAVSAVAAEQASIRAGMARLQAIERYLIAAEQDVYKCVASHEAACPVLPTAPTF